ncbi:hypothetical protein Barb4_00814 [Bacteroidales bacterium Barb4]|nr:hypothetical protein Barb4_00814 [Bacteroidales bacterium Barb4]
MIQIQTIFTMQPVTIYILSFFQNLLVMALLTPHSALLHVGLKSPTPLGLL